MAMSSGSCRSQASLEYDPLALRNVDERSNLPRETGALIIPVYAWNVRAGPVYE